MLRTIWLLPLTVLALYCGAVAWRIIKQLDRRDRDRRYCFAVVSGVAIIGSLPWVILVVSSKSIRLGTLLDLYTSSWLDWPVVGLHGFVVCSSLVVGVWMVFWRGGDFLARHKDTFLLQPLPDASIAWLGRFFLLYPLAYLSVLYLLIS